MTLPTRRGPVDWALLDRKICEAYGLTPRQVDDLTLAEIAVLCIDPEQKSPPTGRNMSDAEIAAHLKRIRSMTPMQRLEEARARRG